MVLLHRSRSSAYTVQYSLAENRTKNVGYLGTESRISGGRGRKCKHEEVDETERSSIRAIMGRYRNGTFQVRKERRK